MGNFHVEVKKFFSLDSMICALFVYWANVHLFYGRPEIFNYFIYVATFIVFAIRFKRLHTDHLMLIGVAFFLILVSLLLPFSETVTDSLFLFLLAGSIGVILSSLIGKPIYILYWWLLVSIPISIVSFKGYVQQDGSDGSYMSSAYYMYYCFAILILLYSFKKRSILFLVAMILYATAIFFTGTRGAIVAVLLSIIVTIAMKNRKRNIVKILTIFFSLLLMIYFMLSQYIWELVFYLSDHFNINSRWLYLIENDTSTSSSGRDQVYISIIQHFYNGNILGLGFGAVPNITGGQYIYAHNFILELLADFGVFSFLMLYGFYVLLKKSVLSSKDENWIIIGLLCIYITLFPRIFTGTLLHSLTLPMIGILLQMKRINKYKLNYN